MKLILNSLVLILSIPLLGLALEPANPSTLCDRFLGEKDIAACKSRMEKDSVDWYAASICNLQKDDEAFWKCWNSVENKQFNPGTLGACGDTPEISDKERQTCIEKALQGRKPASLTPEGKGSFQPLELKKSR